MTDAEWVVVRPLLPVPGWMQGQGGQPEAYCHRAMLDAIGYLVDNGIQWRAMPADFPPWDRVYAFFRRWRDRGLVREFHDRVRGQVRERAGHDALPTAGVIDSQSVKADAVVGAGTRGFDGGKLVNGRKRHVVVDTLGLLLGVMAPLPMWVIAPLPTSCWNRWLPLTIAWPWSGPTAATPAV
ncbi:transposase [Streptomyces sp. NPDC058683]|uniref:transposase n=1 Tax=Streptomyces sp. NPDC058683 TaxID=3346597 RepID=UPI0036687902